MLFERSINMSKVISAIRNGQFVDFVVATNAVVSATNEVVLVRCEKSIYAAVDGLFTSHQHYFVGS